MNKRFPSKIICMTEEAVEFFHAIGRGDVIQGVSVYAKRPEGVKNIHPVISAFTHANNKKIVAMNPDLVLGFSDIQKDIARELVSEGLNVFISNQRSIEDIFCYLSVIGNMIGEAEKTKNFLEQLTMKMLNAREVAKNFKKRPKVYIEEWDEPRIAGIRWFSELVELCGGIDIFKDKSHAGVKAQGRIVDDAEIIEANPNMILACWCGKSVDIKSINERDGYRDLSAIKKSQVFELAPEIFLQPGPAPFLEGIDQLLSLFSNFQVK